MREGASRSLHTHKSKGGEGPRHACLHEFSGGAQAVGGPIQVQRGACMLVYHTYTGTNNNDVPGPMPTGSTRHTRGGRQTDVLAWQLSRQQHSTGESEHTPLRALHELFMYVCMCV